MNRKMMLLSSLAALLFAGSVAWAGNIGETMYGIYSETFSGMKYETYNPPDADGAYMGQWNGVLLSTTVNVAEGNFCLRVRALAGYTDGGVYCQFGFNESTHSVSTDMRAYSGGSLNFWVKSIQETGVKIEWLNSYGTKIGYERLLGAQLGVPIDGAWHRVSVPLSTFTGINLSSVTQPAIFFAPPITPAPVYNRTFYIDNIYWSKETPGSFTATLKNVLGNATTTQVSWSITSANLGNTDWLCADQYVELKLSSYYDNWGIQIYTDNTASGAVPRYTGSGAAAGLVDVSSTTRSLPMCWRIVDVSTNTTGIVQGISPTDGKVHLYASQFGGAASDYPCFFWMKDRHDSDFLDGDDYITAWDNRGIHHAEGPNWGGAPNTNYIYLGAKFMSALASRQYKTGRLIIELFYE